MSAKNLHDRSMLAKWWRVRSLFRVNEMNTALHCCVLERGMLNEIETLAKWRKLKLGLGF